MNHLLKECALDDTCSYLENRHQTMHYKIIEESSTDNCSRLIERGWRRFGNMFFRPVCRECTACESLKIDVKNYRFSKSERRVIRKNADLRTIIQRPSMTQAHLDLFTLYHDYKADHRGWETQTINARNYYMSFVHGYNDYGYEVLYFDKETLIGVDLIDILPNGISSIYFYYHPDYSERSLGRYSLYKQIVMAQENNLDWIYLGYYVQGCQSLEYKNQYDPLFLLEGRPEEEHDPIWSFLK